MQEVVAELDKILESIAKGNVPKPVPSVYDTAWVALVEESGRPLFPECVDWIMKNQRKDGGFGVSPDVYIFDSLLSTASAVLVLHKYGKPKELDKAINFISKNLDRLAEVEYEQSVGFEVLFIKLLETIVELGYQIDLAHPVISSYKQMREAKLAALPKQYIFSKTTSLLHSIEGIGKLTKTEYESLLSLQSSNGSMLNSPSATAFLYMRTGQTKLLKYLNKVIDTTGGYMPVNFPLDNFSGLWVLNMLDRVGLLARFETRVRSILDNIYKYWDDQKGISWSKEIDLPDLDDTAVAYRLLKKYKYAVDADALKEFFHKGNISCFKGELHGGVSHNANLLITLDSIKKRDEVLDAMKQAAIDFITKKQKKKGYWSDKWHLSNIYATTNSITAMRKHNQESCQRGINWLVNSRKAGRWGTLEEDGYALICLNENRDLLNRGEYQQIIKEYRAATTFAETNGADSLWIDKVLYTDYFITHTLRYIIRYFNVK